jgi:hypothetical protein
VRYRSGEIFSVWFPACPTRERFRRIELIVDGIAETANRFSSNTMTCYCSIPYHAGPRFIVGTSPQQCFSDKAGSLSSGDVSF